MMVSVFPRRVMYDHRPSPMGSTPLDCRREDHLSIRDVNVPPGW